MINWNVKKDFRFSMYWYGHDQTPLLLLVWPLQWHGHTNAIIGMASGHTGLMQRYAPDRAGWTF